MSTNSRNNLPVILLFGPTAAGKTDIIVSQFPDGFEVINADSEQVYRHLAIGTAKPDPPTLQRIPHPLIDILEPTEQFTVGDFVRTADRLAPEIVARDRVPIVSGGTAFYIRHFVFGLPGAPPSDPAVREAVKQELEIKGSQALYEEVRARDPVGVRKIHPADVYRISRALEVIRQTGQPLSFFRQSTMPRSDYHFLSIGLTLPREELKERINRRVDAMFAAGLEEEIAALRARGFDETTPGLRGIGYREFFTMGQDGAAVKAIREAIKLHSLQYAKRQLTFFRQIPDTHWFHPADHQALVSLVGEFLSP